MLTNTTETYGLVAQLLHWTTAALILVLIPLGVFMHELPVSSADDVAFKSWFYSLHKTIGVAAFLVAILRVTWAIMQPHPSPLNAGRKLESLAAQTVHWMLYAAIILMPLTGWLHHSSAEGFAPIWWPLSQDLPLVPKSPALAEFFGLAHFLTSIFLGLTLVLHIAGAMKHALIDKDDTLNRMIPGKIAVTGTKLPGSQFGRLPAFLTVIAIAILGSATVAVYAINQPDVAVSVEKSIQPASTSNTWVVDHQRSELAVQVKQSASEVEGRFETWTASIDFDPDDLPASGVKVEVDVSSLALGNVSNNAISPDFLNAARYPRATFESQAFVKKGDDLYEVSGPLALAGRTRPIALPFRLTIEDDRAFAEGKVVIRRLDFGIGEKGFSGDGMVGFDVVVKFRIDAKRAEPK